MVILMNLTEEEQREMYQGLPKKELVEMIIESNKCIDTFVKPKIYNDNK